MATNLDIDDKLLNETVKIGKFRSKKEAVNTALNEYVKRHKQASILQLAGTIAYYPGYDYKANRRPGKGAPDDFK